MEICQQYELPYPREVIYTAWVSSSTVIKPATTMDIDPVVGGHYRLFIEADDFIAKNEGRFLIVDVGRHLRYTWEWNNDGQISIIDVKFLSTTDGTQIEIHHTDLADEQSVTSHDMGWSSYIKGLSAHLESQSA